MGRGKLTDDEQFPIVVGLDFISNAIIAEVYRLGLWEHGRPCRVQVRAHIDMDAVPPECRDGIEALVRAMGSSEFPILLTAALMPMYSAEELTSNG